MCDAQQCCTWTLYGYLQSDHSTFINYFVRATLGVLQLALIWWFPSRRIDGMPSKTVDCVAGHAPCTSANSTSLETSSTTDAGCSAIRTPGSTGASSAAVLPSPYESTFVDPSDGLVSSVTTVNVSSGLVGRGAGER